MANNKPQEVQQEVPATRMISKEGEEVIIRMAANERKFIAKKRGAPGKNTKETYLAGITIGAPAKGIKSEGIVFTFPSLTAWAEVTAEQVETLIGKGFIDMRNTSVKPVDTNAEEY